jgi:hypothetical protein
VAGGGGAGFAELLAATAGLARRGTGRSVGRVVVFPFAVRVVVVPSGFLICNCVSQCNAAAGSRGRTGHDDALWVCRMGYGLHQQTS